jgi:hypothetical protein
MVKIRAPKLVSLILMRLPGDCDGMCQSSGA